MKSIFAQFKKQKHTSSSEQRSTPQAGLEAQKIHHSLGVSTATALRNPRVLILLALFAVLALGLFAYRHFASQENASEILTAQRPKASFSTTQNASKDPLGEARKLFEEKQIEESILVYLKILENKPKDPQLLNDLGVLYIKSQRYHESEVQLMKALEIAPECLPCLNNLGYLKTLQGQNQTAESLLKKALALNSDYIDPYFNLGVLYEKNGDFADSADAYREFINRSKDPKSPFNLKLKQHIATLEK
jgi:Flp pilus assembly protein TadD